LLIFRTPQQGFTLIEILIAASLSAVIMLVLAMGMSMVLKDWERSSSRLEDSVELGLVVLQLERALEGTFPHVYFDRDDNQRYLFFEGKKNELTWISTVSPGRQPGLTAWQLKRGEHKEGVDIRIVPAFASNPTKVLEKAEPISAFEGYKASFEYLYFDEQFKNDTKWLEEWSAKKLQGLPNAVRLRLEKSAGDPEQSLEIIAVIKANQHQSFRPQKP
jgi:general secretion pathway protein J